MLRLHQRYQFLKLQFFFSSPELYDDVCIIYSKDGTDVCELGILHASSEENAKKLAQSGVELIIRTPVVPGFNDTAEEIRAISKFAATLPGVKEHHLLPYHRLGQDKYDGLGRAYSLKEILPPEPEKMSYLLSVAEESGLKIQIGG